MYFIQLIFRSYDTSMNNISLEHQQNTYYVICKNSIQDIWYVSYIESGIYKSN